MKKRFRFTLRVKGTDKEFDPGLGPGVLVVQEMEVDMPDDCSSIMAARWLIDTQENLLKECVEVVTEELSLD